MMSDREKESFQRLKRRVSQLESLVNALEVAIKDT